MNHCRKCEAKATQGARDTVTREQVSVPIALHLTNTPPSAAAMVSSDREISLQLDGHTQRGKTHDFRHEQPTRHVHQSHFHFIESYFLTHKIDAHDKSKDEGSKLLLTGAAFFVAVGLKTIGKAARDTSIWAIVMNADSWLHRLLKYTSRTYHRPR